MKQLTEFDQRRLLILISEGRLTRADIAQDMGRGLDAIKTALARLVELGLVVEHRATPPFFYSLTPDGVRAVQEKRRASVFLKFAFQEGGYDKTNNPPN